MKIINTKIEDVKIIKPIIHEDERGFFMESWNQKVFNEVIGKTIFVQDNHSKSYKGTLRGLHFQTSNPQGKLVRVINGEVFDVVVDLRHQSKTFGKWVGVYLSSVNNYQLWIPEGFAHGFYVVSDHAEFVYKCTDYYNPYSQQTLSWDDPELGILWPLDTAPILSEKDKSGSSFKNL
ncbi:dTDP-4-dehydrorhamnose 3,5-epimerase, partial [Escherichia coli]|nr:dTDP-4-dehydrorhamnose 3,5-epimerase [Escherichia coli]